ncbi:MAG: universal stress protein [Burkholderiaceae bacterium]
MSYKTILVHVSEPTIVSQGVMVAAKLAVQFEAHLVGIAVTGLSAQAYFGDSIGSGAAILVETLASLRKQAGDRLAKFEIEARAAGVLSIEQRLVDDEAGVGIGVQARYSDLVVLSQINPEAFIPFLRDDFSEHVLVHSGRPVLVVPYAGHFETIGRRVLFGWDGSVEAARAVTAALPILKRAELVQVIVLNKGSSRPHGPHAGTDVALYLARHGVTVEVVEHTASTETDAGNRLLSCAADFSADLIVMGGYAHPRLRERLWGGVTQTILASMTVPVFMAH